MFLVDTHTHLSLEIFDFDIQEVVRRAFVEGVKKFCIPNIDLISIPYVNALCNRFPCVCFSMMGLHPTSINTDYRKDLIVVRRELKKRKHIAIGEIGIDFYWDKTYAKEQIEAFEEQLNLGIEWNLPIVIHARESFLQIFESLYKVGINKLRGVFHSFVGDQKNLEEILKFENFMIGINGSITYKNAELQKYLSLVPIEKILLETDAPYLTPVPLRGKRNEPAYIVYTVQKVAEIYNLSLEVIAEKTTNNAKRLFDI
ncbi:MAG: TatD family hydrolase [Candidatus Azobacteroides pseudotrichonymphae]|jgi:TatD DNase family protein|uniref:Deoxyribonuclease n=1 Tax=Azobacteroides pseudotrichonymphae genomovar. CFP2 TaxID=511995 RepID=B6YRD4_AZOPC|nr:TatD family hydrolase [Candidatus Azobacteroides pseudotrichonymphae]MDR0530241.1 TatD family hydrolase [Bacteroidales bacterium OttesenSCG-928-I14]BAG83756.1 putative deoxyribonuclease [Candidatus Azobacteroides pseudotrichonymphae genomovar. CFP2]GMO35130.1 MAG: TatD family hydrolase [Candidatus Azobacteroides pseudotrichonymphae]